MNPDGKRKSLTPLLFNKDLKYFFKSSLVNIVEFSNGVEGWFLKRLEPEAEKSVPPVGKKWVAFHKHFQFAWIAFDPGRRQLNLSLKRLIVDPGSHSNWSIPLLETGLAFPARSVSINAKFQKGSGVIAGCGLKREEYFKGFPQRAGM
jgi:hypothetical protein